MADNYLQFSEIVPRLTAEEEAWLREQLQPVLVFGEQEFLEDDPLGPALPEGEPDFSGPRFQRDNPDFDPSFDRLGFDFAFHGEHDEQDQWGRHLWVYAEAYGNPTHVAWLVQKFLKRFRPNDSWSLTYATACSKPRVGEFGGGALFVTADENRKQDAGDFLEDCMQSLQRSRDAARLVEKARSQRVEPNDLDDSVHDGIGAMGSGVNNGGLNEQITFLVDHLGTEETRRLIEEAANS